MHTVSSFEELIDQCLIQTHIFHRRDWRSTSCFYYDSRCHPYNYWVRCMGRQPLTTTLIAPCDWSIRMKQQS